MGSNPIRSTKNETNNKQIIMKLTVNNQKFRIYFLHKVNQNAVVSKVRNLKNGNKIISTMVGNQFQTECYITNEVDKEIISIGIATCSLLDNFDKRKAMHYSFRNALNNFKVEFLSECDESGDMSQDILIIEGLIKDFVEAFSEFKKNRNFKEFFYNNDDHEVKLYKTLGI